MIKFYSYFNPQIMWPSLSFTCILLLFFSYSQTQEIIQWEDNHKLTIADFQAPNSKIGEARLKGADPSIAIEFAFEMSSPAFMFTKNFNDKVDCAFDPMLSSLMAQDTATALKYVQFSQFSFDLTELYARKMRQKLFENKGLFSNTDFFKPIYDEIYRQLQQRQSLAYTETEGGLKEAELKELHRAVWDEINALDNFCKKCKPPKKGQK